MRNRIALVAAAMALSGAMANAASYTETFPWTGNVTQDQELRAQGWEGGNAGDTFGNNPPGTTANNGGEGAISSSAGFGGAAGFAFWSQKDTNADSFLYTTEFSFSTAGPVSMTWRQSDSATSAGATDPARIALLIGTSWYISDQTFSHVRSNTADWALKTADLFALTYFLRSQPGTALPDGGVGVGGVALPTGQTVSAFGFWWDGAKVANSRFDDVTVSAVPLPAAGWLLLAGMGALGVVRRRRGA